MKHDPTKPIDYAPQIQALVESASGEWRVCLRLLAAEFAEQGRRHVFVAFFAGTHLRLLPDGTYVVVAANAFAAEWVGTRYLHEVRAAIAHAFRLDTEPSVRIEPAELPPPVLTRRTNTWSTERIS